MDSSKWHLSHSITVVNLVLQMAIQIDVHALYDYKRVNERTTTHDFIRGYAVCYLYGQPVNTEKFLFFLYI